jgi:hypothetical protein
MSYYSSNNFSELDSHSKARLKRSDNRIKSRNSFRLGSKYSPTLERHKSAEYVDFGEQQSKVNLTPLSPFDVSTYEEEREADRKALKLFRDTGIVSELSFIKKEDRKNLSSISDVGGGYTFNGSGYYDTFQESGGLKYFHRVLQTTAETTAVPLEIPPTICEVEELMLLDALRASIAIMGDKDTIEFMRYNVQLAKEERRRQQIEDLLASRMEKEFDMQTPVLEGYDDYYDDDDEEEDYYVFEEPIYDEYIDEEMDNVPDTPIYAPTYEWRDEKDYDSNEEDLMVSVYACYCYDVLRY